MNDQYKTRAVLMAFDFGSRRVGVAIASQGDVPTPLATLERGVDFMSQLKNIIIKHQPEIIVVGRPRNLDGETTAQTHRAEQFAKELADTVDAKVVLTDEALSTERARQRISTKDKKTERQLLDQIAAQIILEDYIDETK